VGSATAFPAELFNAGDRWLGIKVGVDPEMPTRFRPTPSPWAIRAEEADHATSAEKVDGLHASSTATPGYLMALGNDAKFPASVCPPDDDWTTSGQNIYRLAGNVGIGTDLPQSKLHTRGPSKAVIVESTTGSASLTLVSEGVGSVEMRSPAGVDDLRFYAGGADRMTIGANGCIGIGTVWPSYPLTFPDTLGDKISLWEQGGNHIGFGVQSSQFQFIVPGPGDSFVFGYGRSDALTEGMHVTGRGDVAAKGTVAVDGDITKAFTPGTQNRATPIAYATINADGSVASGTPNVSSFWAWWGGWYQITISGESYSSSNYQTLVMPVESPAAVRAGTSPDSGRLIVRLFDSSSHKFVQRSFSFVTYKP